MSPISPQSKWHCYDCSAYFAEPIRNSLDELPLCPVCTSEVVVDRESDSEDEWHSDGPAPEREIQQSGSDIPAFPGLFNPPSMTGNRIQPPITGSNTAERSPAGGGGFLGMLNELFGSSDGDPSNEPDQGPAVRTFSWGSPADGGMVMGGSISFGGPSRLRRGPDGRIPLPDSPPPNRARNQPSARIDNDMDDEWETPDIMRQWAQGQTLGDEENLYHGNTNRMRQAGGQQTLEGMMQSLMAHLMQPDGNNVPWFMPGTSMNGGRMGDYVFTQDGFDQIMERMMEAAEQQNRPPPASQTVIKGLPRLKMDSQLLDQARQSSSMCNICFEEFKLDEEVIRIPCKHIFHTLCLTPWLEQNGTCPMCRFSLVPESERNQNSTEDRPLNPQATPFVPVLQSLANMFLGGDTASNPAPSSSSTPAQSFIPSSSNVPTSQETSQSHTEQQYPPSNDADAIATVAGDQGSSPTGSESENNKEPRNTEREQVEREAASIPYATAIPDDYREAMKRREEEMRRRHG